MAQGRGSVNHGECNLTWNQILELSIRTFVFFALSSQGFMATIFSKENNYSFQQANVLSLIAMVIVCTDLLLRQESCFLKWHPVNISHFSPSVPSCTIGSQQSLLISQLKSSACKTVFSQMKFFVYVLFDEVGRIWMFFCTLRCGSLAVELLKIRDKQMKISPTLRSSNTW